MKSKHSFFRLVCLGILLINFTGCKDDWVVLLTSTTSIISIPIGYEVQFKYSYLPYTADSAKIDMQISELDSMLVYGFAKCYDSTRLFLSNHADSIGNLILEHDQPLPLTTPLTISLIEDATTYIQILSHIDSTFCGGINTMNVAILPIQVYKGEIVNICGQDMTQKENKLVTISQINNTSVVIIKTLNNEVDTIKIIKPQIGELFYK